MKKLFTVALLLFIFAAWGFYKSVRLPVTFYFNKECPPEGSATTQALIELNKLKNRAHLPSHNDFDHSVTLKKILEKGDDTKRWNTHKAAKITGYVYDVKPGGVETCNCKTKDLTKRDTHIEILVSPMHNKKMLRMIVEITPRLREQMKKSGEDWSTKTLRDKLLGRWVTFSGWLFFDEEHTNMSENTSPGRERNWRATAWEIHPVTKIEVTTKPNG